MQAPTENRSSARKLFEWAAFSVVLGVTILTLSLIAIPAFRNQTYFALGHARHSLWLRDSGEGLPAGFARLLRPSVPVWVEVEPQVRMLLDPNDLVDASILATGGWEPETWHSLSEHIERGGVFVDVGAHIGYYSLKAAKTVGPKGRVFAIEPNPETLPRLQQNIKASGALAISVQPVACSDSDGTLELFSASHSNTGSSSLSKANASIFGPVRASFRVPVRRLDEIIKESGVTRVDVIKIDVEGAELMVLKGAQETLDRFHPVVTVEVIERQLESMGTSSAELTEFLRARGYVARHSYEENVEFAFTSAGAVQTR